MVEGWAYEGAPPVPVGEQITLVEGRTFCISDQRGDFASSPSHGLIHEDTRFLSRFELRLDGEPLEPLTVERPSPYAAVYVTRRRPRGGRADSTLLVVRRRYVSEGLAEEIELQNLRQRPAAVALELMVDTDFAGIFEVKEGRAERPTTIRSTPGVSGVSLEVETIGARRRVDVVAEREPGVAGQVLTWQVELPARGTETIRVHVVPVVDGVAAAASYGPGAADRALALGEDLAQWRRLCPIVSCEDERIADVLVQSAHDLGGLRIRNAQHPDRVIIAAGAPWFMTLFGRDSLITSWMLLPVDRAVALGTLHTLADLQGTKVDPVTEEEPGKILHEVRSGLDAGKALGGGNVYYGTIDATPLFVVLVGELHRWGASLETLAPLLPHVDRAMDWLLEYGDRDGDGFVEYQRATDRGLVNQGWKDSFDAVSFASGQLATGPIALAEVQGYTYAAFRTRADLAASAGDTAGAERWAQHAESLRERFDAAFWLPDRGYYAMALDGEKRPVDALASNMGQCLLTGIVPRHRAGAVAQALLGPEMFTGFGVRTLGASMGGYNPMSYHNGSVWPHDNAIIAAGLMRYGFVEEAHQIALGLLDAAASFGHRLPELFCGFPRREFAEPVPYPTSCSPQAWAAATPVALLRTLLRLHPHVPHAQVRCAPAMPAHLLPLHVDGFNLGASRLELHVDEGAWELSGVPEGLTLVQEAAGPDW